MRTKKEIEKKINGLKKQAINSIMKRYPHSGRYCSTKCSPRVHSKILALEWVLGNTSEL